MKKSELSPDLRLKHIGEKVRELRLLNPDYKNYEVFAYLNKISKMTVYKIERGENYNIISLLKVLDALHVQLADFFSDID